EGCGLIHQLTKYEIHLEQVNTVYWGWGSSLIVALFKTKTEAMKCFGNTDLKPCDPRWLKSTKLVLEAIGDGHPSFSICHFRDLELLPAR
ncbi:MAG: hypothetical protein MIO92_00720, partial [Methanosarcinaceae archaeon]|nr:hypothetical protein [Methanosarcinaceae archaeon]